MNILHHVRVKDLLHALVMSVILLMSPSLLAKRSAPKKVTPVVHEGVEYHAPLDVGHIGVIQAIDPSTKKLLWQKTIYKIVYNEFLERDTQWVFISDIKLVKGKLLIQNERGKKFTLDPKTKEVNSVKQNRTNKALHPIHDPLRVVD